MSNGIYDILGKLASLTPKEEPKQETSKTIYESVEARGSMLEGVSAIESKLQKEFVAEKAKNPYAIGMAAAKKQAGITKKHATGLPKSVVVKGHEIAKSIDTNEAEEPGVCEECGMTEGECEHTKMAEGEKVKTSTGIRHKGTYGTEYQGDSDEEEEQQAAADTGKRGRGRPRKGAPKAEKPAVEKKGRGRPRKDGGFSKGDGGLTLQNILLGKAPKGKGTKGRVHRLGESVNFKRLMDDTNMTVDEMIASLQNDIKSFKQTGSMSEMLRDFLDLHRHSRSQADEAVNPNVPAVFRKQAAAPGEEWKATAADIDAQRTQHLSSPEGLAQRKREMGIDATHELNELARLAGLAVKETASGANAYEVEVELYDRDEPVTVTVHTDADLTNADEDIFASEIEDQLRAQGIDVDENVAHWELLNPPEGWTRSNLGDEGGLDEADAPVAQPKTAPVNAPEPKYGTVKQITTQGDDMNRQKKQFASKPRQGDNPMTPELDERLAEMYNSIKKQK